MAYSYTQQANMPPAIDPSMQGAPGAPQMPAQGGGGVAPPLMGVQAQQPIPMPGQGQYVNPALAASVLALQNQQSQQQGVDRSRKMADALRGDAKDQVQGQQVGRVFKSAGLANLAASLAASYGASRMNSNADTAQTALNTQRQKSMQDYFNALVGNSQQPSDGSGQ